MNTALAALAVAAAAYLASAGSLRQARSTLLAQLSASGFVFLAFGLVAGPSGFAAVPERLAALLNPVLSLGFGIAGLALGLSLEPSVVLKLPGRIFGASFVQALLALLPCAAAVFVALGAQRSPTVLGVSLAGAAVLMLSSSHFALLLGRANQMPVRAARSVALVASLEDLAGIALYGAALMLATWGEPARGVRLFAESSVLGLCCAALAIALLWDAGDELAFAVMLGLSALLAGACAHLRISALVAGAVAGSTISFLAPQRSRQIFRAIARVERPLYLVVLFLLGSWIDVRSWVLLGCALGLVLLRGVGKLFGGRAVKALVPMLPLPAEPGYALLSPAPIAMCALAELSTLVAPQLAHGLLGVGVLGALGCEIASAVLVRRSVIPVVSAAPAAEAEVAP